MAYTKKDYKKLNAIGKRSRITNAYLLAKREYPDQYGKMTFQCFVEEYNNGIWKKFLKDNKLVRERSDTRSVIME